MSLTVRAVEAAKPQDKPYKLADEKGLYLYVSPAGGKSWRANYSAAGKQKTRTYGRWPGMTLAQARKAHQDAREYASRVGLHHHVAGETPDSAELAFSSANIGSSTSSAKPSHQPAA